MTTRWILCEGPEDVAAVREIATRFFGAKKDPTGGGSSPGAGREIRLRTPREGLLRVTAVPNAKSALPGYLATALSGRPPQTGARGDELVRRLVALYDPDEEGEPGFVRRVGDALRTKATDWTIQAHSTCRGGAWLMRREDAKVLVRTLAWRAGGDDHVALPRVQNLERVLCRVLVRAYPAEVEIVDRWLAEIGDWRGSEPKRRAMKWKAAIYLWSALVADHVPMQGAPDQFLGQHDPCKPHVESVLREAGLYGEFARLCAGP
jgi:hypothetical protein